MESKIYVHSFIITYREWEEGGGRSRIPFMKACHGCNIDFYVNDNTELSFEPKNLLNSGLFIVFGFHTSV